MLKNWWFTTNSGGAKVAAGIIVPFMDVAANIPSGWAQFSYTNEDFVRGGTSTGSGGSPYATHVSSSYPNHTGTTFVYPLNPAGGSGVSQKENQPKGLHSHSVVVTATPQKRKQIFMKASSEQNEFPANAGVLGITNLGLTKEDFDGATLAIANGADSSDVAESIAPSAPTYPASHTHNVAVAAPAGAVTTVYGSNTTGTHTHSVSGPTTALNHKKYYMDLWSSVSAFDLATGMFALYESGTAPEGWSVCDGTGGTPDLVDSFIGFDQAKVGTSEGDDTMDFSASLPSAGSHNHRGSAYSAQSSGSLYHTTGGASTHTVASTGAAWVPPHYTLVVIKYTG